MEWLPTEADFLTVFGAVLAAGVALLGLVTGLNQFSNTARARRLIEWTSEALTSEKNTNRRTILENLKLRGQGHLIAGYLVPWWRFSDTFLVTLLASLSIIAPVKKGDVLLILSVIVSSLIILTQVTEKSIKIYIERVRIEHQFVMGNSNIDPLQAGTIKLMHGVIHGRNKGEELLSFSFAISVLITSGLLAWALTAGQNAIIWAGVFVGVLACWGCVTVIRSHAKKWARE